MENWDKWIERGMESGTEVVMVISAQSSFEVGTKTYFSKEYITTGWYAPKYFYLE